MNFGTAIRIYSPDRVTTGSGFTRIFHFYKSSDCGGARSLLRREGTAELVAWELVQVSLPYLDRYMRYSSPL